MQLKKSLSLFQLTVYGVGTIIGSGIYSVLGPAAQDAGQSIWLSFILAAVVASFSAFSYAELATALPNAGAEHNFLRNAFPKFPAIAFLVGMFIAIHGAATIATVALTFASYLKEIVQANEVLIALVLIVVLSVVNIAGLKRAAWVNVGFTIAQVSGLLILAVAAFTTAGITERLTQVVSAPVDWGGAIKATGIIFFIYTGYEHLASLSEEAKNPEKDLWKAFLIALFLTTFVYLMIVFAVLTLIEPDVVKQSSRALAVAGTARAPILGHLIAIAALLATANATLSGSISVSRLLFGVSRAGDLPKPLFEKVTPKGSPWLAIIVVILATGAFVLLGEIKQVASLSSLGALLVFTAINFAVIFLRFLKPDLKRPFRIRGAIAGVPILPALGVLTSLALATRYDGMIYVWFAVGVMVASLGYLLSRSRKAFNK
ncbi:MAG: amino acid permease [Bdellovibrionaceae bacterium]|nr:amino acid permease [Pseudobdellovibrionaceae bacterium]